jgi:hypothetical protein
VALFVIDKFTLGGFHKHSRFHFIVLEPSIIENEGQSVFVQNSQLLGMIAFQVFELRLKTLAYVAGHG